MILCNTAKVWRVRVVPKGGGETIMLNRSSGQNVMKMLLPMPNSSHQEWQKGREILA
ncbi:hypothetical protein BDV26DRAFT_264257 [Aspergillus bertholletiae]|uniref:Uncharacterized protein n=1 Tax=Aspergillus bertholletiae TaxID=1226010 RepID=A0A5N7B4V8_9EURO|nr:hypothetical protein BDV26DRAFT_264257 [Aspergillus bertholletiae]